MKFPRLFGFGFGSTALSLDGVFQKTSENVASSVQKNLEKHASAVESSSMTETMLASTTTQELKQATTITTTESPSTTNEKTIQVIATTPAPIPTPIPVTITVTNDQHQATVITSFLQPTETIPALQSTSQVTPLPIARQGLSGGAITGIVIASSSVIVAALIVFLIRKWQLRPKKPNMYNQTIPSIEQLSLPRTKLETTESLPYFHELDHIAVNTKQPSWTSVELTAPSIPPPTLPFH